MRILTTIGHPNSSIQYTDRPTVKVIIKKDDAVLLLNQGLLPGGGVDDGESDFDAMTRELQEELGVTVRDIEEIGTVIQYRNFLHKKYSINGYTVVLDTEGGLTSPKDEGEAHFTERWLDIQEALAFVSESIVEAKLKPMDDDANQGKLYNLMTTYELLQALV